MELIGQKDTKELVLQSKKPCILVGKKGMGKLTLSLSLYPSATVVGNGKDKIKVEEIRDILSNSINMNNQIYIIRNCDNTTVQSQNALLKILEECPEHVKFIILAEDLSRVLETIKSRCNTYIMPLYTDDEIAQYAKLNYPFIKKYQLLQNYCMGVIGRVDRLSGKKFKDIRDTALKIVSNLEKASVGNIFNIVKYLEPIESDLDMLFDTMMVMYYDIHLVSMGLESEIVDFLLLDTYKNLAVTRAYENVFIMDKYKSMLRLPYNLVILSDNLMLELKGVE